MARIRALKPEAFQSETLSEVSVCAERTFLGLTTQADDRGRLADKPAVLNGAIWPMRQSHTPADLEAELVELCSVGDQDEPLVCRYVGCDGKRYMHLVTWDRHQKVERPSKSRMPRCPHHPTSVTGASEDCGYHGEEPCPPRPIGEPSPKPHRGFDTQQNGQGREADPVGSEILTEPSPSPHRALTEPSPNRSDQGVNGSSVSLHRSLTEASPTDLGPWIVDPGPWTVDVPPPAGAPPPAPGAPRPTPEPGDVNATAQTLIAEWIEHVPKRPPRDVIGQVGKRLKAMLTEGIDPGDVRAGLARWADLNLNPSSLPSVVNEVMNGGTALARASPKRADHRRNGDDIVADGLALAARLHAQEQP